jgi:hypothetical protein
MEVLFDVWDGKNTLTQQLSSPSEQEPTVSTRSIWLLLLIISSLQALFVGELVNYVPQAVQSSRSSEASSRGSQTRPLPRSLIYEQNSQVWIISSWGGVPQELSMPGYIYNYAVPPLLTPSGQLLYTGDGIWMTNPFSGHPRQIANLPAGQVITSLVLNQDGSQIAWTSVPAYGQGTINLYIGSLEASTRVYQQPAGRCPCFRVFSFWHDPTSLGDRTLLLTDDHGDHGAVQDGLWILHLNGDATEQPQRIMASDPPQGPLALAPDANHLLYASWEGYTPVPDDDTVGIQSLNEPTEAGTFSDANDLHIATIDAQTSKLASSQVIVPGQPPMTTNAIATSAYHWITTPRFSPDGHTLAYFKFTSDVYAPFARESKIYIMSIDNSGAQITRGSPKLLASGDSGYIELGNWLNNRYITLYAGSTIYSLDVQSKNLVKIVQTEGYAQIVATVA